MGLTALVNGVMIPVGELARRDGVSPPAVSKAVKRLVERHGLSVEKDHLGRVTAVNAVQYDMLRGRLDDPSKAQAPERPAALLDSTVADAPTPNPDSYDEAIRRKTLYGAELARLKLAEEAGYLIRVDEVIEAGAIVCSLITELIDALPDCADEISVAVARDGARGAQEILKAQALSLRTAIADKIERVVSERKNVRLNRGN
jgi:DNA-binding Lrp family transcriptional regulator